MSSDYLNYELSKELHDLGVVFNTEYHYYKLTGTDSHVFSNEGNIHQWGKKYKWCCYAPSTAQLIDEIASRRYFVLTLDEDLNEFDVSILYDDPHSGKCATTALGKALIALVKEDRKCQVSKTS